MSDSQYGINEKFEQFLHTCDIPVDEYCFDIDEDAWEEYRDLYEFQVGRY